MSVKVTENEKSFFNTDFGKVLLAALGFLAFNYFMGTKKSTEEATKTNSEILATVTKISVQLDYNTKRIGELEASNSSFMEKPRFTEEDSEAKLVPLRNDIYELKADKKATDAAVQASLDRLNNEVSELNFKVREGKTP